MYMTKFKAWGLEKKNKRQEVEAILQMKTNRMAVGKRSVIMLRGRPVNLANIERYVRRNGLTTHEQPFSARYFNKTLNDITCFTPPGSPLTPPAELCRAEKFFIDIQTMVRGFFDTGIWLPRRESQEIISWSEPDEVAILSLLTDA